MLIVPGAAGEIGVLARHAPLVATLKAGSTRVHVGANEVLEFATGPGFFKVELDRALALVDDAVNVEGDRPRPRAGAARGGAGRAPEESRAGDSDRRPLAARAAHPARREPARRRGPHDRLRPRLASGAVCRTRYAGPPESFERQLGDQDKKRLKSPRAAAAPDTLGAEPKLTDERDRQTRRASSTSGSSCSTAPGACCSRGAGCPRTEYRGERFARPRPRRQGRTRTSST